MKIDVEALRVVMEKENIKNASQLAKRMDVSRSMAWRILNGQRTDPSPKFLEGVKKCFPNYPLDYFLLCS
jgi:transcriptional regulator with XRE-family HTH domain